MNHVYIVQHAYEIPEGAENIKLIGVYSSEEKAKEAIARLCTKPGFREYAESFSVDQYILDKDHWSDGFISWDEAMDSSDKK